MLLTLNSRHVGNVYVIQCVGRLVLGEEVKALEAALDQGAHEYTQFVLNLGELNRLDSIAMGLLVRYAERMNKRGGGVRLAAPPPFVETLLHMTKLSSVLPSFPTEDEAIQSFLKHGSPGEAQAKHGPRVLVVDESADLCVFVRTVLARHGYDVRSTCSFRDAKTLLQVVEVEYILVGPGTPQLSSGMMLTSLIALAPKAIALKLDPDFKIRDAREATNALLEMFEVGGTI